MNKSSNTYIIMYAAVLVIVVAAVLSFASLKLQRYQNENIRIEKKSDILVSVGLGEQMNAAADKTAWVNQMYEQCVSESFAVNAEGDVIDGANAFNLLINLKGEYDKPAAERQLPVFVGNNNGVKTYVIPVWGKGLWGPIWGYIALKDDWNTVSGVVFGHKGETPGLGAELATAAYQSKFVDKQIFNGDQMVGIALVKGGAKADDPNGVDAISGGTLTSRGAEDMIKDCLSCYLAYINKQKSAEVAAPAESVELEQTNSESENTK